MILVIILIIFSYGIKTVLVTYPLAMVRKTSEVSRGFVQVLGKLTGRKRAPILSSNRSLDLLIIAIYLHFTSFRTCCCCQASDDTIGAFTSA